MHLTRTAEYSLRAMAHLALLGAHESVRAQELAEATAIPVAYLSKVMRRMVLAGLVVSQKGHGGGFGLARAAKKITFSHVLLAAGVTADDNECAFGHARCNARSPCPLHFAWKDLAERFSSWANETTLADVEKARSALVSLRLRKSP